MAGMTNDVKNSMLDSGFGTGASSGTYISLHTADPTVTVATALANELVGANYARVQLNLAAASGGSKSLGASAVINIQATNAFSYYALWSVGTKATGTQAQFKGSAALSAAEGAYGANGTYTITALTVSL